MKNLRKNFLFGFGIGGGGGGGEEAGTTGGVVGTLPPGGGGVRGTFDGGIAEIVLGVAGVGERPASLELDVSATGPGGAGADVLALADPGSTAAFESVILGFLLSVYPLCRDKYSQHFVTRVI